jgi:hypothetical protein
VWFKSKGIKMKICAGHSGSQRAGRTVAGPAQRSVLSYPVSEIVIVDVASTDEILSLALSIAAHDPRIQ